MSQSIRRTIKRLSSQVARVFRGPIRTITGGAGQGLKIHLDRAAAYVSGDVEEPVQTALASVLHEGDTFYDIGANVGFFTLIGAKHVGPAGLVYAFEPVPANAWGIERNAQLNDFEQVVVVERAVSDLTGPGDLILTQHAGGATLTTADVDEPPDATGVTTVEVTALDDWIRETDVRPPDVVKIDVEGAEESVLRGMTDTLRTCRPIILCEVDGSDADDVDVRCTAIEERLHGFDYVVSRLEESYLDSDWSVVHFVARPSSKIDSQRQ